MATPLGGIQASGLKMAVKNVGASDIKKGNVVALIVSAGNPKIQYLDLVTNFDYLTGTGHVNTEVPLLEVQLGVVDVLTQGGGTHIGIAAMDIPINKTGEIIITGLAKVLTNAAIATVGTVLAAGASGNCITAVSGTHSNPIGVLLEATTATNLIGWALVNFLASASGLPSNAAYTRSQIYQGKAF